MNKDEQIKELANLVLENTKRFYRMGLIDLYVLDLTKTKIRLIKNQNPIIHQSSDKEGFWSCGELIKPKDVNESGEEITCENCLDPKTFIQEEPLKQLKYVKCYLHESYNNEERIEHFEDRGLNKDAATELAEKNLLYEIELLIDINEEKIVGCEGFFLSEKKYEEKE